MQALAPVHQGITSRKLKSAAFLVEGLNSLATTYFFYYLYFYTKAQFKFAELQNLWLAAGLGFLYALGAICGGRFAQKFGYYSSIQLGVSVMLISFLACGFVASWGVIVLLAMLGVVGMCFTWPAVEALVSEGELPARLPALVGFYNFVWSVTGAFAYFTGGLMMDRWGLRTIFFVPAAIMLAELALISWVEVAASRQAPSAPELVRPLLHAEPEGYKSPVRPQTFLRLAWVANPMAYIAANTVIPTIPSIAKKLDFSPAMAGFVCSLWLFARTVTFVALRLWPGWHYRFGWLAWTYVMMIVAFAGLLLAPNQWILMPSEALFGVALGLIYYSSLFYSMDIGDTKGEHGGLHEAAIGLGNGMGPGIAALALTIFPAFRASGTCAVCAILLLGLLALFWIRFGKKEP
ncbi:MAG TPA: MFS transporter [Verrucomicrobiae bacterium]|nr:MFS transporter [Verrucomicrobiae bacterium]